MIGQIVRYDFGPTALMLVDAQAGNGRYYGKHCMGGTHGALANRMCPASPKDLATWKSCAHWRGEDIFPAHKPLIVKQNGVWVAIRRSPHSRYSGTLLQRDVGLYIKAKIHAEKLNAQAVT